MAKNLAKLRAESKAAADRKGTVENRLRLKLEQRRVAEERARKEEDAASNIQPTVQMQPAEQGSVQTKDSPTVATGTVKKAQRRLQTHCAVPSEESELKNIATGAIKKPQKQTDTFEGSVIDLQPDEPEGRHVEDKVRSNSNAI